MLEPDYFKVVHWQLHHRILCFVICSYVQYTIHILIGVNKQAHCRVALPVRRKEKRQLLLQNLQNLQLLFLVSHTDAVSVTFASFSRGKVCQQHQSHYPW